MKKSRCILAVLLCAVMVMALVPAASVSAEEYSGTCGDNLTWELDTDTGVLTISGTGEMTNYVSASSAPWYEYNGTITTIIIENGVESIGMGVFNGYAAYENLTSVTLSDTVTYIGDSAFAYCGNISDIEIPDSVTYIGGHAFYGCTSLTSVTINYTVATIDTSAFSSSVIIYGYIGSAAEDYAEENGNEFISLGETPIEEVYVSTYEELTDALDSNRRIIVADGVYSTDDTLYIRFLRNVTIIAENSGKAEILSTNGYMPVVEVISSENVSLNGLILGHESVEYLDDDDTGGCGGTGISSGYVLGVCSSENVEAINCDLYGCGTIGVYLEYSPTFEADGCVIRDCKEQITTAYFSNAVFTDCIISGNAYDEKFAASVDAVTAKKSEYNYYDGAGSVHFDGCVFLNNYSTNFASNEDITTENCIFKNNVWDGGTPVDCGVCLNGITWEVEDDILYLGGDLIFDNGDLIESEMGEVLPYSTSSLPWKKYTFNDVVTKNGVTYEPSDDTDTGNTSVPVLEQAYATVETKWIEDENGYMVDSGEEQMKVTVTITSYTPGEIVAVGYLNNALIGFDKMNVFEYYDGYAWSVRAEGVIDSINADTVKIFYWNSLNGMIPLCDAINAEMY